MNINHWFLKLLLCFLLIGCAIRFPKKGGNFECCWEKDIFLISFFADSGETKTTKSVDRLESMLIREQYQQALSQTERHWRIAQDISLSSNKANPPPFLNHNEQTCQWVAKGQEMYWLHAAALHHLQANELMAIDTRAAQDHFEKSFSHFECVKDYVSSLRGIDVPSLILEKYVDPKLGLYVLPSFEMMMVHLFNALNFIHLEEIAREQQISKNIYLEHARSEILAGRDFFESLSPMYVYFSLTDETFSKIKTSVSQKVSISSNSNQSHWQHYQELRKYYNQSFRNVLEKKNNIDLKTKAEELGQLASLVISDTQMQKEELVYYQLTSEAIERLKSEGFKEFNKNLDFLQETRFMSKDKLIQQLLVGVSSVSKREREWLLQTVIKNARQVDTQSNKNVTLSYYFHPLALQKLQDIISQENRKKLEPLLGNHYRDQSIFLRDVKAVLNDITPTQEEVLLSASIKNISYNKDAFLYYLSGIIQEWYQRPALAKIEYARAYKTYRGYHDQFGTPLPQQLIFDYSRILQDTKDLQAREQLLKENHIQGNIPQSACAPLNSPTDKGELIFLSLNGLFPKKMPQAKHVPFSDLDLAYAEYYKRPNDISHATLQITTKSSSDFQINCRTALVQNLGEVALQSYDDKRWLVLLEKLLIKKVEEKILGAELARKAYIDLSNWFEDDLDKQLRQADTRMWKLLPSQIHLGRIFLPPGTYQVTVHYYSSSQKIVRKREWKDVKIEVNDKRFIQTHVTQFPQVLIPQKQLN